MIRMFPRYYDINDWEILETLTIHAYDTAETPIEVIKVKVGFVDKYEINLGWQYTADILPVIRWITRAEYNRLKEREGTIIW